MFSWLNKVFQCHICRMADTDRNQQLNIPFREPTFIIKSGFQIGKMCLELVKEVLIMLLLRKCHHVGRAQTFNPWMFIAGTIAN